LKSKIRCTKHEVGHLNRWPETDTVGSKAPVSTSTCPLVSRGKKKKGRGS